MESLLWVDDILSKFIGAINAETMDFMLVTACSFERNGGAEGERV